MDKKKEKKMWFVLRQKLLLAGFTYKQIDNDLRTLGGSYDTTAFKLNTYNKLPHICHKDICICGKEGIVKNYYVGTNRNNVVVLGSKCYKVFPMKIDFRTQYRNIKL